MGSEHLGAIVLQYLLLVLQEIKSFCRVKGHPISFPKLAQTCLTGADDVLFQSEGVKTSTATCYSNSAALRIDRSTAQKPGGKWTGSCCWLSSIYALRGTHKLPHGMYDFLIFSTFIESFFLPEFYSSFDKALTWDLNPQDNLLVPLEIYFYFLFKTQIWRKKKSHFK